MPSKIKIPACYMLIHKPTGMFYIGSTSNILSRKRVHKSALLNGQHANPKLTELFRKYGKWEDFEWKIFLVNEREEAFIMEQELLDLHWGDPLLLNSSKDARKPICGIEMSADVFEKRRKAIHAALSQPERRALLSATLKETWNQGDRRARRCGEGNPFAKPVWVNNVRYGSVKDAMRTLKLDEKTIRRRAVSTDPEFNNYSFADPQIQSKQLS